MLPSADAAWVGGELARRFGLPFWQMAMTATDANRFVLRFARHLTGRPKVLVFDWCYHGTVDETFATLDDDGRGRARAGHRRARRSIRRLTTKVVQFNDLDALRGRARARATWPACWPSRRSPTSASCCPSPGSTTRCASSCDRTGTLLVIDETHTICAGPGGATAAWGLRARLLRHRQDDRRRHAGRRLRHDRRDGRPARRRCWPAPTIDVSGVGGTLTGNALALAAVRATLVDHACATTDFAHMIPLAERVDRRRAGRDRRARAAVERAAARVPGRVLVLPAAPQRSPRPRPPSTTSSTRSCTSTPSTGASCSRRSTTWR